MFKPISENPLLLLIFIFLATLLAACNMPQHTLTIQTIGKGSIKLFVENKVADHCNQSLCSFSFTQGTEIKLDPAPDPGQFFSEWEGACNGHSECLLRLNKDEQVIAKFQPIQGTFNAILSKTMVALPPSGENRLRIFLSFSEDFNVPEYAFQVELSSPLIGDAVDQVKADLRPPDPGSGELVLILRAGPRTPRGTTLPIKIYVGPHGMRQELTFLLAIVDCTGGCNAS